MKRRPFDDGWDEVQPLFEDLVFACNHEHWDQVLGFRGWVARKFQHQEIYRCWRCSEERTVSLL